ncbi:MAG: ABC transporter permease [Nocardioidaceae bacterium]
MSVTPPDVPPRGVIHDLGYRPYDGVRQGEGAIAASLFVTGLRNVFGLGRSGRSKILPWGLLALNLLPAVIIVGVMVMIGLDALPLGYARYASTTQILVSIFVASQAPILFSHDLRHGSIVLYLARPLRSATYALVRFASLWAAVLIYLVLPILVLWVGALLAELDLWEQTVDAGQALVLVLLLAAMLAGVSGIISSWSTRRGFAVVATIMVLLVADGVVAIIQGISSVQDADRLGQVAGLLSPYAVYRGTLSLFDLENASPTPPEGAMQAVYVGFALALVAACLGLLVARYRKVGNR